MADPISLASGLLALTTFAIGSTKTLYEVVDSFRNSSRNIRELKQELEALDVVLQSLQSIQSDEQIDLSTLKLPLLRCGEACRDFAAIVEKSTARSNGDRASFRDWVLLTYRGKDIAGFRNVIGAYKSTIAIALADANIRHTIVTAQLLREYKQMINDTTSDLQEILTQNDIELAQSPVQGETPSPPTEVDQLNHSIIEEERANIEYCLNICKQVANHLEQVQVEISGNATTRAASNNRSPPPTRPSHARLVTSEKLFDCRTGISFTISELQLRLQDADHRLQKLLHPAHRERGGGENSPHTEQIHEDVEAIRQCLSICDEATEELAKNRTNVYEEITIADDSHQIIVATMGDLISAKKVSAGARSKQWIGQMSDNSLQRLSADNASKWENTLTREFPNTSASDGTALNIPTDKPAGTLHYHFEGRHGTGRPLG